jgi:DNA gyrase subunit A
MSIRATERNGDVVTIMEVVDNDELIIVTHKGILIRLPVHDIRSLGRVTQGVRLINLGGDDLVMDVERVPQGENDDIEDIEDAEIPDDDGGVEAGE